MSYFLSHVVYCPRCFSAPWQTFPLKCKITNIFIYVAYFCLLPDSNTQVYRNSNGDVVKHNRDTDQVETLIPNSVMVSILSWVYDKCKIFKNTKQLLCVIIQSFSMVNHSLVSLINAMLEICFPWKFMLYHSSF